jgi:cysteine desulfurase
MKVYLDNSATTKPYEEVIEVMSDAMKNHYGNPSSMHSLGLDAERLLKSAKQTALKSLGCKDGEIVFTSGGTESNNLAIEGAIRASRKEKNHIITTTIEHKSVHKYLSHLEKRGYEVTYLGVNTKGVIDINQLKEAITDKTALITIMLTNNEVGSIQPVEEISKHLKTLKRAPIFHVDGIQAYAKMKLSLKKMDIDMFSVSAHKVHGPKGVGFLYIKKGLRIEPMILGGDQQNALRAGTENVYSIVGFEAAIKKEFENLNEKNNYIRSIRDKFVEEIVKKIPNAKVNTALENEVAVHIANISFPGMRGEVLLHTLEQKGIYVSVGSACNSKNKKYSYVLDALGLNVVEMESAIRFSFSHLNTFEEIDYAVEEISKSVEELNKIIKGK